MSADSARFSSLLDRFEAATARLEAVASRGGGAAAGAAAGGAAAAAGGADAPRVAALDAYLSENVQPLMGTLNKIGDDLTQAATLLNKGFSEMRRIVAMAAECKKPSDAEFAKLLAPIGEILGQLSNMAGKARGGKYFNHLMAISEGAQCLSWPGVPTLPASFVREMVDAAQFYANKIMAEYRKSGPAEHTDLCKQWKEAIEKLSAYVKEHHTTGLVWNPKGKDVSQASASSGAAPASSAPAAAPPAPSAGGPPPPPPPPSVDLLSAAASSKGSDTSAADLMAELNKGADITKGLRKVTSDMKTKNRKPEERSSVVTVKKATASVRALTEGKRGIKLGSPRVELERNTKWVVEFQQGNREIVIDNTEMRHVVYIYGCADSVVQIKGKVNAITMDNCIKTGVVFENAVSSFDMVNCQSVQVQVTGKVPTISVDKTDGCQIYLGPESLDTVVVTAKSSETNVNVPHPEDPEDTAEQAIPEQLEHRYDAEKKKWVSTITESLG